MPLIGLHGGAGHGKDTVCEFIREWCEDWDVASRREAFADRLKLSAARLFFPDLCLEDAVAWCNQLKTGGKVTVTGVDVEAEATGRELLQRYGTESHRDVFGSDFWVDAALADYQPNDELLIVTDVRFQNEADAIHHRGGQVWRVLRIGPGAGIPESDHKSEIPLPPEAVDNTIWNCRDLAYLRQETRLRMLEFRRSFTE